MFKESIKSGFILPVIIVLATAFNFNSALYSSNLSWFEVCVSVIYLLIWGVTFSSAWKNKNYNLIRASAIFWITTFILSSLLLHIRMNNADIGLPLLLVIPLITPLFGLEFLTNYIINQRYIIYILISAVSFVFSSFGLFFLITNRKK